VLRIQAVARGSSVRRSAADSKQLGKVADGAATKEGRPVAEEVALSGREEASGIAAATQEQASLAQEHVLPSSEPGLLIDTTASNFDAVHPQSTSKFHMHENEVLNVEPHAAPHDQNSNLEVRGTTTPLTSSLPFFGQVEEVNDAGDAEQVLQAETFAAEASSALLTTDEQSVADRLEAPLPQKQLTSRTPPRTPPRTRPFAKGASTKSKMEQLRAAQAAQRERVCENQEVSSPLSSLSASRTRLDCSESVAASDLQSECNDRASQISRHKGRGIHTFKGVRKL